MQTKQTIFKGCMNVVSCANILYPASKHFSGYDSTKWNVPNSQVCLHWNWNIVLNRLLF